MIINSSSPDLSMLFLDIVENHMDLHDLNISGRITNVINRTFQNYRSPILQSSNDLKKDNGNTYNYKKFTKINLNLESYGISSENSDIFVGNLAGCMSPSIYLFIMAGVTVFYYIIQIILSCFFFKPKKRNRPEIHSIILFYLGILFVLLSTAFYFCSYNGINSFYTTFYNFNTTYPAMMASLSESLDLIVSTGIPNAISPLIDLMNNVSNETQAYFENTTNSFLNPTIEIFEKLSSNQSELGVFPIYDDKIKVIASEFYSKSKKYPKLKNLPRFFNDGDFSPVEDTITDLLIQEYQLKEQIENITLFFEYFNSTVYQFRQYIINLTNQTIKGRYETISESIQKIQNGQSDQIKLLYKFEKMAKNDKNYYNLIIGLFFALGILLILFDIFYSVVFMMHNKVSLCVANSISVFPIIATLFTCFLDLVFLSTGFTDYDLSIQLEFALDNLLSDMIDKLIPGRVISFTPIDMSYFTNNEFEGVLNLSSIYFPRRMTNIQHFVDSDKNTGIIDAFDIENIINMSKYGLEIGGFIISMGNNYTLSNQTNEILDSVSVLINYTDYIPPSIDAFFNWGIPMSVSADYLRALILKEDPIALTELNPYLDQIIFYKNMMNDQYNDAISLISNDLKNSLLNFDSRIINFVKKISSQMGSTVIVLSNEVYPVLNSIRCEPLIGPYALLRNALFYDISNAAAYITISGFLMMIGFPFIVTLMWIRRKGMLSKRKNEDSDSEIKLRNLPKNNDKLIHDRVVGNNQSNDGTAGNVDDHSSSESNYSNNKKDHNSSESDCSNNKKDHNSSESDYSNNKKDHNSSESDCSNNENDHNKSENEHNSNDNDHSNNEIIVNYKY